MARYRKCPRPCAEGNTCKWITKMLQQVPPLKCPYFLKNVSSFMLWRPTNPCPRLEIPADFVQGHGDKFNDMVEVKGPRKSTWYMRVNILVCKHRRVMLDRGWRTLVKDLGLNQGDHLLFVLTAFSKFKVYVFDDVGIRRRLGTGCNARERATASPSATSAMTPSQKPSFIWPNESESRPNRGRLATQQALCQDEEEDDDDDDDDRVHPEVHVPTSEPWKRRLRGSSIPRPAVVELSDDNCNPDCNPHCKEPSESEYTLQSGSEVPSEEETDSFQSSAFQKTTSRSAFQKSPSRNPSFIKKVPAISLKNDSSGQKCTHLEVPATFTQRYDGLFKERVSLQGPTGRVWHVVCQITVQQQYQRVQLRAGWFDFAVDNMLKVHDQLLFTHVAEGQFRVQIVTKGHRRRGRPRQVRQEYSPGISKGKVHQDGARMIPKDQTSTPDTPTSTFQQPDINKDPLKSRIHQLQQQLLAQRRTLYKKVEDQYTSKRGRMEWGLGHS